MIFARWRVLTGFPVMAGGRMYGIVLDGSASMVMYIYLALEFGMAGVAFWALARSGEKSEL